MLRSVLPVLILLLALPAGARERSLDEWLARDLVPYVNEQLASLPRFRNESLRFVVMREGNPVSEASALALHVRDTVRDAARDVPGIRIAWPGGQQGISLIAGSAPLDCTKNEANYLVGVELTEVRNGLVEIYLRALDIEERTWVTGFSKSWRGEVHGRHRIEIRQTVSDPTFRGERDAPWQEFETDLMAAQLAYELGCGLLRQTNGEYVVAANDIDGQVDPTTALVELVGNNLAGMRALQFAAGETNAVIEGKAHRIDDDLFQYWVTITPTNAAGEMTTLSADAYVRIADTYRAATLMPEETVSLEQPADGVLDTFELRRLQGTGYCAVDSPWLSGASSRRRGADGCFALQARAADDAVVFFLNHQLNYGLVRLADGRCGPRTMARIARANEEIRHPLPPDVLQSGDWSAADQWSVSPRTDTYYVIAAADTKAARALSAHLEQLPQRCTASVRPGLEGDALRRWLEELTEITKYWSPAIDWRSLRVKDVY
jgi:hypothetical protein